jgi:predicted GIY-YIG superfamily endonuclease
LLHNNGSGAQPGMPGKPRHSVQSTAPYRPWTLVGSFQKRTRSESMTLERKLKNLNREDLLRFIHRYLPDTIINFTKP